MQTTYLQQVNNFYQFARNTLTAHSWYGSPRLLQKNTKSWRLFVGIKKQPCFKTAQTVGRSGGVLLQIQMRHDPGSPVWVTDLWIWRLIRHQNTKQGFIITTDRILQLCIFSLKSKLYNKHTLVVIWLVIAVPRWIILWAKFNFILLSHTLFSADWPHWND